MNIIARGCKVALYSGSSSSCHRRGLNPGTATPYQALSVSREYVAYLDASPDVQGYLELVDNVENQLNLSFERSVLGQVLL
jgi:hypothetical protein